MWNLLFHSWADAHSAQFQHVEISNEPIDVDAGGIGH